MFTGRSTYSFIAADLGGAGGELVMMDGAPDLGYRSSAETNEATGPHSPLRSLYMILHRGSAVNLTCQEIYVCTLIVIVPGRVVTL